MASFSGEHQEQGVCGAVNEAKKKWGAGRERERYGENAHVCMQYVVLKDLREELTLNWEQFWASVRCN